VRAPAFISQRWKSATGSLPRFDGLRLPDWPLLLGWPLPAGWPLLLGWLLPARWPSLLGWLLPAGRPSPLGWLLPAG